MDNIFIKLIQNKKINTLEELKKAYRKFAKKTHPDIVGSDQFVEKFIKFKDYFEEAKHYLQSNISFFDENNLTIKNNYRFLFFQELSKLDTLEMPHNKSNKIIEEKIKSYNEAISILFKKWEKDYYNLFKSANLEYNLIKKEKPKNNLANLRKPSLYFNLKPVIFNICNYHITGLQFYQKQSKRSLDTIIKRLEENNFFSLKKYLLFLIKDMDNGPAVFG